MATAASAPKLRLQYFNIEGPAEKSRLALSIAKIPFTDDRVVFDQWQSIKPTTPYGQLPLLYMDETKCLAQSDAILRYCGRLANDAGVPLYDSSMQLDIDEALGLVDDMLVNWRACLYIGMNPKSLGHPEEIKGTAEHDALTKAMRERWMREEFPRYVGFFNERFKKSKYLVGDSVTIADCALIPQLRRFCSGGIDHVSKDCLEEYPEIKAYYDRFHAIPEVAAWYEARAKA